MATTKNVMISAPKFGYAQFEIKGVAPLVNPSVLSKNKGRDGAENGSWKRSVK